MDILNRIDELRVKKGWSMYRLAEESNLPSSTLINMFSRKSLPSIPTLIAICDGLGVSVSMFFADNQIDSNNNLEIELLNNFRLLDQKNKSAVLMLVKNLLN